MNIISAKSYNPWYFPKLDEYKKLLENNNFKVECIEIIPRKTKLDTDIKGWLKTFANNFFVDIKQSQHNEVIEKIEQNLKDNLFEDGNWYADYVRLRFKAIKI